jgi:hypothetical protein
MSIHSPSEMASQAKWGKPDDGILRFLRTVSLMAIVIGAVGSVGFMLRVGHRKEILFLLILFVFWVTSPFVALALAHTVSQRWAVLTRATLYCLIVILTLCSLVIYGYVALGPRRAQPASAFLVVPLGSWLLFVIVIPLAALISGRLSRRSSGNSQRERRP